VTDEPKPLVPPPGKWTDYWLNEADGREIDIIEHLEIDTSRSVFFDGPDGFQDNLRRVTASLRPTKEAEVTDSWDEVRAARSFADEALLEHQKSRTLQSEGLMLDAALAYAGAARRYTPPEPAEHLKQERFTITCSKYMAISMLAAAMNWRIGGWEPRLEDAEAILNFLTRIAAEEMEERAAGTGDWPPFSQS
jgi:hypothetical protein